MHECDELYIISGYVGPNPIKKLENLPINCTVIYGMYGSDGISQSLHNKLLEYNENIKNVHILYSKSPVHSKCYIWMKKGEVSHALIGSANFTSNGLNTPGREMLSETTIDSFKAIKTYLKSVIEKSIECEDAITKADKVKKKQKLLKTEVDNHDDDVCSLPLYIFDSHTHKKIVPERSGLNWGQSKLSGSHVNISDAYIAISAESVSDYPTLFPLKSDAPKTDNVPKRGHRDNDTIDVIWDDGTSMECLLEGSRNAKIDGRTVKYPKQISSSPKKKELGIYIRNRLGINADEAITMDILNSYGRDTVDVSLIGENIYYFDFSVNKSQGSNKND